MCPTKVLVAKLDHNVLDVDMGVNAICCVAISLIGLLSLASIVFDWMNFDSTVNFEFNNDCIVGPTMSRPTELV
jgi:hypothetical protein